MPKKQECKFISILPPILLGQGAALEIPFNTHPKLKDANIVFTSAVVSYEVDDDDNIISISTRNSIYRRV